MEFDFEIVLAKFIGADGSLGFRKNQSYKLRVREYGWFKRFFLDYPAIYIEAIVEYNYLEPDPLICPYSSKKAFLNNWEILNSTAWNRY